jgi:SAM-dependent methyltransferase
VNPGQVKDWYGKYFGEVNLNVGCGYNHERGFTNIDKTPKVKPQIVFDLEDCATRSFPFPTDSVDFVYASHVMEHIRNIIPCVNEIWRVLKPGGYFLAVTPHIGNDHALSPPEHIRPFSELTWYCFDKRFYDRNDNAHCDSGVESMWTLNFTYVPTADFIEMAREDEKKFMYQVKHYRNVVQEMHCLMEAIK